MKKFMRKFFSWLNPIHWLKQLTVGFAMADFNGDDFTMNNRF